MGGNDSFSVDSHLRRAAQAAFWATLCAIVSHVALQSAYLVTPTLREVLGLRLLPLSERYAFPISRSLTCAAALCWLGSTISLARAVPQSAPVRRLACLVMLVACAAVLWRAVTLIEWCLLAGGSGLPAGLHGALDWIASAVEWMRLAFAIAVGVLVHVALRDHWPQVSWLRWRVVALIVTGVVVWVLGYAVDRRLANIPLDWPSGSEDLALLEWAFLVWGCGYAIPLLGWRLWLSYVTWRAWHWREKPTATDEQQAI